MDELGRLLLSVCAIVPKGVVVFLPSYDYEQQAGHSVHTTPVLLLAPKLTSLPFVDACV